MSVRNKDQINGPEEKSIKIAKVAKAENDFDDYDIEVLEEKEGDEQEEEEEEEDGEEYFSLQPYEIFDIVMHPEKQALENFLLKDEKYEWEYSNPLIKRQIRSKSIDMCQPIEDEQ